MFNGLATKLAMKKMGIPKNALDMSALTGGSSTEPNKLKKNPPGEEDADAANANGWPKWMTVKSLPLTAQAWLNPPPPPVPVAAECPKVGDLAPLDRDRKIEFGGGRRVLVVFLRCVGCACKSFFFFAFSRLALVFSFTSASLPPPNPPRLQSTNTRNKTKTQSRKRPSSPCAPSPTATSRP